MTPPLKPPTAARSTPAHRPRCPFSEVDCARRAADLLGALVHAPVVAMAYCAARDRVVWTNGTHDGPLGVWSSRLLRAPGGRPELFANFRHALRDATDAAAPQPFITVLQVGGAAVPVEARLRVVDRVEREDPHLVLVVVREAADAGIRSVAPFEAAVHRALLGAQQTEAAVTSSDLNVTWATAALDRRAGYGLVGRSLLEVWSRDDRDTIVELARLAAHRGAREASVSRALSSGGRLHVVDRSTDYALRGLVWWWRDAPRVDLDLDRLRLLGELVEQFTGELAWAGFGGMTQPAVSLGQGASLDTLTSREREILELLTKGLRTPSIAARLYITPSTVRSHLTRAFKKLGVMSQAEYFERLATGDV